MKNKTIEPTRSLGKTAGIKSLFENVAGKVTDFTENYPKTFGLAVGGLSALTSAAAEAIARGIHSGVTESTVGLTKNMLSKALGTYNNRSAIAARELLFQTLKQEDPILADTDDKTLSEAYTTMTRIAPTLSQDKNAVRSFLTQAATSGSGLDFTTIKGIADAELAVARARNPGAAGAGGNP